jgi:hypothetical protein
VSPDGKQVAAVSVARNVSRIMLFRPDEIQSKPTLIQIGKFPINDVRWAGNDRLLVQVVIFTLTLSSTLENTGRYEEALELQEAAISITLKTRLPGERATSTQTLHLKKKKSL